MVIIERLCIFLDLSARVRLELMYRTPINILCFNIQKMSYMTDFQGNVHSEPKATVDLPQIMSVLRATLCMRTGKFLILT